MDKSGLRRGHCPSAGAPLASGDGLLSRVQLLGGRLHASQLRLLALLAEQYCAPQLELTQRGNLQFRGFSEQGEAAFSAQLIAQGLAASPAKAEAARKLLCSAAADIDPTAIDDPYTSAAHIDAQLRSEPALWSLPSKFRVVLNGGGATGLARHYGDIRADALSTAQGPSYRLGLGGDAHEALALGLCSKAALAGQVLIILNHFAVLASAEKLSPSRPGRALDNRSTAALRKKLSLEEADAKVAATGPAGPASLLGGQPSWFGLAPPLGVLDSATAQALAALAERFSGGHLRLCPGKQILLPGAPASIAASVESLGLIYRADDPRLSIVSCPGAPACRSGSSNTRGDALSWAEALPEIFDGQLRVHVSGCAKGCAHPRTSPITLRAHAGRYDLIVGGRADSQNSEAIVASQLSPSQARRALAKLGEEARSLRHGGESLEEALTRLVAARSKT